MLFKQILGFFNLTRLPISPALASGRLVDLHRNSPMPVFTTALIRRLLRFS